MPTIREERLRKKIRGATDPQELAALNRQLAAELRRAKRPWQQRGGDFPPPLHRKTLLTPLDRPTEQAVEFLVQLARQPGTPAVTAMVREAIRREANRLGWAPPQID